MTLGDFDREQRALAGACWQLVAVGPALDAPNAWIRRSLYGADVFIQSFDGQLRGFHNVCSHRGFPLRTGDAGVGPVQCGFHGWVYSRDGVPTGVPRNAELFQLSRDDQRALALAPIRVESIGRFVFATQSATAPALADDLGRFADVLQAVDASTGPCFHRDSLTMEADWKLYVEISLDDYHLPLVHPTTFGATPQRALHGHVYEREGRHSCLLIRRDADWSFASFWDDVRRGVADPTGYKIFNCFPNLYVSTMASGVVATVAIGLGGARTRVETYLLPWRADPPTDARKAEVIAFTEGVIREDQRACEAWQTTVGALRHRPTLGKLEQRVAWFHEAYAALIGREELT